MVAAAAFRGIRGVTAWVGDSHFLPAVAAKFDTWGILMGASWAFHGKLPLKVAELKMHTRISYSPVSNCYRIALSSFWVVGWTACRYGDNDNHNIIFGGRSLFSMACTGGNDA